ncbi:MAG: hypothetical protein CL470_04390 [Acidimicrobiaceae bacterium]|nr:hypothetical protein [Acidimicrobiaceae bacterium]|tara:strand:+ start:32 stop:1057 length:1026 start_codon:yes stop_codon:yes gene_type:complete
MTGYPQEEISVGSDPDQWTPHLAEVLEKPLGKVRVTELTRLTGGANRETWSFNAIDKEEKVSELILQLDRAGLDRLVGTCAREARIVNIAHGWNVPVATVIASSETPNPFGRSFTITRRIHGETIARKILRDAEWKVARSVFVNDCASSLAAIHSIPKKELEKVDLIETADSLLALTTIYDALCDPHPTFDLAIRWLEANRPEPLSSCLVHGDFRLGNLLVDEDGLRAVLDWEIAHFGDPGEDLGWMCVRAWRFGGNGNVAGLGSYQDLLDAYEKASGMHVPLETLLWWEIFGTLRWGIICLQMGGDFRSGRTTSIEIATIGRRVAENEYDLLLALKDQIS